MPHCRRQLRGLNRRGVVPGGRGPRYASRPIVRSIGLDSSPPFIWETCADGTAKGPMAIRRRLRATSRSCAAVVSG